MQFMNDVILHQDRFYNGIINLRVNKPPRLYLEKIQNLEKKWFFTNFLPKCHLTITGAPDIIFKEGLNNSIQQGS